ncbi:ABC transporter ATP-binding protein [Brevibacillus fluminis]|uniref:ABC transporter ATP-binding protein n=1 Tax=Brevibacillus fluminis TaxID=511487 RepID=UPI003F8BCACA
MLIVDHVSKTYRVKKRKNWLRNEWMEHTAVSDLSFQLEPGKIVGLLGINGAGKTTTIKMCTTLLEPTSGSITINGLDAVKDDRQVKRLVNMIAGGERMLYWRLTARENLAYFGSLYGLSGIRLKNRIDDLLAQVGLADAADKPVEQYSKGMKQRLQIARGLINDPAYLFLDEPTLGLDAPIARHLRQHVKELATQHGKAILLTSHYMHEIEELCDEVLIIDKGKLIARDTPERLTKSLFKEVTLRVTVPMLPPLLADELERVISQYKGSCQLHAGADGGTEIIVRADTDLTPVVLSSLATHRSPVLRLTTQQASLEDVILHLAEVRSA